MPEALDPTQWPRWCYHVALDPVMVATPDEEAELPEGYRPLTPFTPEERTAHAKAVEEAATSAHKREVARLEQVLVTPAKVKVPPKPAPPTKEPARWTPSGRTGRRR